MLRRALALASALLVMLGAQAARAQPPEPAPYAAPAKMPLRWAPRLPEAAPWEYAGMAIAGAGAFAFVSLSKPHDRHWDHFAFDEAVRGAIRLHDTGARATVRTTSDYLWYLSMGYPILETLFVVGPRSGDVAWQLLIVDGEGLALGALESQMLEPTTGRDRPFVRECVHKTPGYEAECLASEAEKSQSFISGHTLMSFTGAGLTCANHLYLSIYGSRVADTLACAGAVTVAATEGTMRVMSDRHYASDVLIGATMGFATGYGLPVLLRYRRARGDKKAAAELPMVMPYATSTQGGVVFGKRF